MKSNSELIVDENGIEVLVGYDYEEEEAFYAEPGNPATAVAESIYTKLTSVEVVIAGVGVDILPLMTKAQKESVISKLSHNE